MNAVCPDHQVGVEINVLSIGATQKPDRDAVRRLLESLEAVAGKDGIGVKRLPDLFEQHRLQLAAVDRVLRPGRTGMKAARIAKNQLSILCPVLDGPGLKSDGGELRT